MVGGPGFEPGASRSRTVETAAPPRPNSPPPSPLEYHPPGSRSPIVPAGHRSSPGICSQNALRACMWHLTSDFIAPGHRLSSAMGKPRMVARASVATTFGCVITGLQLGLPGWQQQKLGLTVASNRTPLGCSPLRDLPLPVISSVPIHHRCAIQAAKVNRPEFRGDSAVWICAATMASR